MENLRVRYSLKDQSMNFPFQNTTTIYKPQYKKDLFGFEKKRQKLCSFLKKNMVQVSSEYISIGCNRTAHAASWGNSGLVAFGADTLIALYSPLVRAF